MALTVSIGVEGAEVDLTAYLVDDSLRVEQRADSFVSTASFSLVDETGTTLSIKEKDSVLIEDGATIFFAGVIANLDAINIADGPESVEYEIECQDYNILVEQVTIDSLEEFPNGVNPARDDTVIDYMFDNYLPEIDSHAPGAGGYVEHLHTFAEIEFENITLREVLDRIATEVESIALAGYWYIDYEKYLHYFNIEDNAPAWGLSDNPDDVTTFSYFAAVRKSRQGSAIANRILVVGADVALLVQDLDSYAYYGKWFETVVRENTLESVAEILDYGNSLLARWAYPDEVYTVTTYKAGLRAGMNVEFENTLFGTRTRKNWIENPSFEVNATDGWTFAQTGAGGSVVASADFASVGAMSAKLISSNGLDVAYIHSDNIVLAEDETITVQARMYRATAIAATISIYDATNAATRATGTPSTDYVGMWEFLSLSWTNDLAGGPVNVQLRCISADAAGDPTYFDGCMAEINKGEYPVEYIDGTLPYCDWDGGAHDSTSTRSPVYTVRQMSITWPKGDAEYKLTLGGKVTSSALISSRAGKDASDAGKGPVVPGQLPISSRGWAHNITFGGIGIDNDTMPWGTGTLTTTGGVTYSIGPGDTGNMAPGATYYIYLDTDVSLVALQTSVTAPTGAHKILVAIAQPQAAGMLATVIVYGGGEGSGFLVDTERIVDGAVSAVKAGTTLQGWSQAVGFSATDNDTVAWAGGNLEMADGTTYVIAGDDTGNMVARTYIYFDLDIANNALQHTTTPATAVGNNKLLIAVAEDVADAAKKAYLQAYGGDGTSGIITGDQVVANTITVTELAADSVTTVKLVALNVTGAKIAAATIEAGKLVANTLTATQMAIGGFGDLIFDTAGGLLLLGPRCEMSATSWVSLRGQTATLSGGFRQVAGRWLGTKALIVETTRTNIVENPSFEVNITDYWALGDGTRARVAGGVFGDYCAELTSVGAAATYLIKLTAVMNPAQDDTYTHSAYIKGVGTGIGRVGGIRIRESGGLEATRTETTAFTLTGEWQRVSVSITVVEVDRTGIDIWCYFAATGAGQVMLQDGSQLQTGLSASSVVIGDMGSGYTWGGTAHNSTSGKARTEVNLDAHADIFSDNDTVSIRIIAQMPYDSDGDWPQVSNYLWDYRGADNNNRTLFHFSSTTEQFTLYMNGATRKSFAHPFSAGDWIDAVVTFDYAADSYFIYVNGVQDAEFNTVLTAPTAVVDWTIASGYTGGNMGGYIVAEVAVMDRVLTLAECETLYMLRRPLGDAGAMRSPGIYILDGRFTIASSTSTTRIEITAEEIVGYNAGTKQFYLQASDGKAYFSGGDVMLDVNGITLNATNHIKNTVKWKDGAVSFASISSYQDGIAKYLLIKAHAPADTGDTGVVYIVGQGPAGEGDSYIMMVSERVGANGYVDIAVGSGGLNVVELKCVADYVKVTNNLAVGDGLYVGSTAGVPGNDMIYVDSDIRGTGGLSLGAGAHGVNPDPGDITITGTIATAAGNEWDLQGVAAGAPIPDKKIFVEIDGTTYWVSCQEGP